MAKYKYKTEHKFQTILMIHNQTREAPGVGKMALWLGYLSSTINPLIYTVFNAKFRSVSQPVPDTKWPWQFSGGRLPDWSHVGPTASMLPCDQEVELEKMVLDKGSFTPTCDKTIWTLWECAGGGIVIMCRTKLDILAGLTICARDMQRWRLNLTLSNVIVTLPSETSTMLTFSSYRLSAKMPCLIYHDKWRQNKRTRGCRSVPTIFL